jgi:hypothetical protein
MLQLRQPGFVFSPNSAVEALIIIQTYRSIFDQTSSFLLYKYLCKHPKAYDTYKEHLIIYLLLLLSLYLNYK